MSTEDYEMGFCWDRDRHEREGRDAARYRRDYGWEHEEKLREARWRGPDSCASYYAEGYERERRFMEEQRREEEEREQHEMWLAEKRRAEQRAYEEAMYEVQMQAEQEQQACEPPYEFDESVE